MAQEAIRLISPVGRIIWGSPSERATKDYDGKEYPVGTGPFQFGFAVLKNDSNLGAFLGKIYGQAMAGYPNNAAMHQRIQNEWQSGFAGLSYRFKIKDGDKPNARGIVNPNGAGCFVFTMATSIPFKCANAQNIEIDPKTIERGYYVDIAVSCKVNDNLDGTAGIYLNPEVVRLIGYGEKIVGGITAEEAFAGHAAPTQLPPGASLVPVAPAAPSAPGTGSALPGFTPQAAPATGYPSAPQNGAPVNAPGFAPSAAAPQMPGTYAPTPAPTAAYPSNPAPGAALPGFTPPGNAPSPTGYPTNPATGQPFQPHTGFVMPGGS